MGGTGKLLQTSIAALSLDAGLVLEVEGLGGIAGV
jgi:hypothetical protein